MIGSDNQPSRSGETKTDKDRPRPGAKTRSERGRGEYNLTSKFHLSFDRLDASSARDSHSNLRRSRMGRKFGMPSPSFGQKRSIGLKHRPSNRSITFKILFYVSQIYLWHKRISFAS
ncbi:hypothetical protein ElyMa_005131500 [Elysia marginata]|uniref:Myelin basic protein n=1 Tax=Elysia marginata TaxID=1093978 RepID=A0AAV4JR06_9GAST|nr:hypothetical protein ElyMa_005131500 [Elysia marginata]